MAFDSTSLLRICQALLPLLAAACGGGSAGPVPNTDLGSRSEPSTTAAAVGATEQPAAVVNSARTAPLSSAAPSSGAPRGWPADERVLMVTAINPHRVDMNGPALPAPCDFERLYRGVVGAKGQTKLSLWLRRGTGDALTGKVHYDKAIPAMNLTGVVHGQTFHLDEAGGGRFQGSCNDKGELSGTFVVAGSLTSFDLYPRPSSWPPVYGLERSKETLSAPAAATNPELRCRAHDNGIRFFGGTASSRAAANVALTSPAFANAARGIRTCETIHHSGFSSSLMFHRDGVVTVGEYAASAWGAAATQRGHNGVWTVDLRAGRVLKLRDIVTDPSALRPLVDACARDFLAAIGAQARQQVVVEKANEPLACDEYLLAEHLWDCPDEERSEPTWGLAPDGIGILGSYEGGPPLGPVISWAALVREGLLKASSPVRRLWGGVAAEAPAEPACRSGYSDTKLIQWKLLAAGPPRKP